MTTGMERSRMVETSDTIEVIEECYRLGWSDGLPVVPPADYKVREMLDYAGLTGEEEILTLEMRQRVLTSENVAANAVMAGCLPEYFPALITALRTLDEDKDFIHLGSASTSSPSILTIINGPVRHQIGVNSKDGVLGPGFRANACIGRAIRLALMNGFDARPGTLDRGTLGNPTKYTFCIGDNEEDNPWGGLHVSRGFQPQDSCVTVAVAYNPVTVNNRYGHTGESILYSLADTMKSAALGHRFPGQWVLLLGLEHAMTLKQEGWSRRAIQEYLLENAARPKSELIRCGVKQGPAQPGDDQVILHCARKLEDILLVVCGGTGGRYSAIIDTAEFEIRTRKIDLPAS